MKMTHAIIAAGAAALLATTAIAAGDSKEEKAVEARQGLMELLVWEAGPLFAMAKGDVPYDAEVATTRAGNLVALTTYSPVSLFVPGSSTKELGDDTRALPAIWEKTDQFIEDYQTLGEKAEIVAAEAGKGAEALRAAVGDLGRACGACHDDFRKDTD